MKNFIFYICLAVGLFSFAQEKAPDLPRFSLRMNVGIPKISSSAQYRHSFTGVITADGSLNYRLFSNFNVGLGYNYTYFKCQKYFRDPLRDNINTTLQVQNGYLKLSYDRFFSDNGFLNVGINMGAGQGKYSSVRYKHDSLMGKTPTEFSNSFVEPIIGLYFIVDPNFAIGAHISYNYSFTKFDPLYPQFHQWGPDGYTTLSNKWTMSMINLGFGFYYGLARKP